MKFLLQILMVVILCGCFAKTIESTYYLMDYVPTPPKEFKNRTQYSGSVRIKDFDIAEAYRRNNLVYRQSPYELKFYNYELWAVKPEYMITDILYRHLQVTNLFSELKRNIDADEADYIISGTINALEEYDNQDDWYAHIALTINLQDRYRRFLWSQDWDLRKKVALPQTIYVIRALSDLMEVVNNEAIAKIDSVLSLQTLQNGSHKKPEKQSDLPHAPQVQDTAVFERLPPPGDINGN